MREHRARLGPRQLATRRVQKWLKRHYGRLKPKPRPVILAAPSLLELRLQRVRERLREFRLEPGLPFGQLVKLATQSRRQRRQKKRRLNAFDLCAYVRHMRSNYIWILNGLQRTPRENECYRWVKLWVCCQIIRQYGLRLDPVYAAYGTADYGTGNGCRPAQYVGKSLPELEQLLARELGIEEVSEHANTLSLCLGRSDQRTG